ncbi:MAG: hypothetical protein ACKPKO_36155, partial [Candidatus Fonsibacter sp.]
MLDLLILECCFFHLGFFSFGFSIFYFSKFENLKIQKLKSISIVHCFYDVKFRCLIFDRLIYGFYEKLKKLLGGRGF